MQPVFLFQESYVRRALHHVISLRDAHAWSSLTRLLGAQAEETLAVNNDHPPQRPFNPLLLPVLSEKASSLLGASIFFLLWNFSKESILHCPMIETSCMDLLKKIQRFHKENFHDSADISFPQNFLFDTHTKLEQKSTKPKGNDPQIPNCAGVSVFHICAELSTGEQNLCNQSSERNRLGKQNSRL